MSSLIIIDSNIKDLDIFQNSIKKEHKIIINNNNISNQEIYNNINDEIKYLTFVYHFQGFYQIPFFNNQKYSEFSYFSDNLIELLQNVKEKSKDLTLDLLSCDINNIYFASEVKKIENKFGIKVRFSVNKTGNISGDWILESDNTNIKDFYFNDDINNWKHTLAGGMTTDYLVTNYGDYFEKSGLITKIKDNVTTLTNSQIGLGESTDWILLNNGEIFDGNNKTINFNSIAIYGLFRMPQVRESINMPTIQNLVVSLSTGTIGDVSGPGGGIVGNYQQFFRVNNCRLITSNSGSIQSESGGICGAYSGYKLSNVPGNAIIENCYSSCLISGDKSGGICGYRGGHYGKITITKCYSTGNIVGDTAGGIAGMEFGFASSTSTIEGCYSNGTISGSYAGGIIGFQSGNNQSNIIISKSYSKGNIEGIEAGGICGSDCAQSGKLKITECFSLGKIEGTNAGGITGSNCGNTNSNNLLEVSNCYSIGTLTGTRSGGILGSNCGFNNGSFKVLQCYSVGISSSLTAGGIIGYNGNITSTNTSLVQNCYCGNSRLSFKNSVLTISNSETNLNKIKNKIDPTTNFNTNTIWKIPSSSSVSLNMYPRLQAFSNPTSSYYLDTYLTYNNLLDYNITNTIRVNIDPSYYVGMTNNQIYNLRSLIITDVITKKPTLANLIISREALGFTNQTNSSLFKKLHYKVLKANNTISTSYILKNYITTTNGVYLNLVNATDKAIVTLKSGTKQTITKTNNSTYTFQVA